METYTDVSVADMRFSIVIDKNLPNLFDSNQMQGWYFW